MFINASYDDIEHILTITFNNGTSYEYLDVPSNTFNELKNAESEGKYFSAHIKNSFKFKRQE